MLNRISLGWHWMEQALNAIIDEVNKNTPVGSATITAEQSPNGTVLRVVQQNNQSQGLAGAPGAPGSGGAFPDGQWISVKVLDDNCNESTIQVWGKFG